MNISIIGGDKRNQILVSLFEKDHFFVYRNSLGFENENDINECILNSNVIVTAIPFSKEEKTLNAPFSNEPIKVKDFIKKIYDKTVIGGKFSDSDINKLEKNGNKIIDLMKDENLACMNAIPTVEGVLKTVIENTESTINDSKILIIGFGRIGKRAAKVFGALGANIYCMDVSKEELANISISGYNVIEKIKLNQFFDVIINTVPEMVLDETMLKEISKETFILDVASNPGGVDFEYAKNNGYNVIHELGIPGKVAPLSTAKYIKQRITEIIL